MAGRLHAALRRGLDRFGVAAGGARGDALGVAAAKLAHAVLALAISVVLARVLGPEGFGVYALAIAVVLILGTVAQLGLPVLVLRETARARGAGEPPPTALVRRALGAGLGLGTVALCGTAVLAAFGGLGEASVSVTAGALLVPMTVALGILCGAIAGSGAVVAGQVIDAVLRSGFLLIGLGLVLAFAPFGTLGPIGALALNIAGTAGALAIALSVAMRKDLLIGRQGSTPPGGLLQAALPLGALGGVLLINANADLIMLGWLAEPADVGIYRAVGQVMLAVVLHSQAVLTAVQPRFAALWQSRERTRLQRLVRQSALASTLTTLAVGVPLVLLGGPVLGLVFGEPFAAGAGALALLIGGAVISAALGPSLTLAGMTGLEAPALGILGVALAGNLVLNAALIPAFGLEGAAFASALSQVGAKLALGRLIRRRTGIVCFAGGPGDG